MPAPFENPAKLAQKPQGMTFGKAAALAGGALVLASFVMQRRNTRVLPSDDINDDVLRPDSGTTQQVGTNRYQQQHRHPPPSKKTNLTE
ncbi:hypothetical protein Poli38472_011975 [Pythium oligandrum]|uniref:Uncharacterized protein n=1 Tax=Pythium oligandrum TaxID=41045 RepID=A0A8K1CPH7_PYTOL|nr:hypothetical protein Poli38472_011975 [Pythium oligandrum]|eukprot:TMW66859.1 hypothetical protein Poli38472_011975 [Pythium oligandrum]